MAGLLRVGGGIKGRDIKDKVTFFKPFFQRSNVPTAIKHQKGGGALREELFFAASLTWRVAVKSNIKKASRSRFIRNI